MLPELNYFDIFLVRAMDPFSLSSRLFTNILPVFLLLLLCRRALTLAFFVMMADYSGGLPILGILVVARNTFYLSALRR